MKVRVIGGGWYGCHVALELKRRGVKVTLIEAGDDLFSGASAANQSRLHLGFHYPRCHKTRADAIRNYRLFMRKYGALTKVVPLNIYAIARDESLIDFETYAAIMDATTELPGFFLRVNPQDYGLRNCEGAILTGERLIDCGAARNYFRAHLAESIRLNEWAKPDAPGFDWTINCTYGGETTRAVEYFEPCIMFLLNGPDHCAVTIMDGPHGVSVYPWWGGGASLTSVSETCLGRFDTIRAAREAVEKISDEWRLDVAAAMAGRMEKYWPGIKDFRVTGYVASIRAKPAALADTRQVAVDVQGQKINIMPGKISAVFDAWDAVEKALPL